MKNILFGLAVLALTMLGPISRAGPIKEQFQMGRLEFQHKNFDQAIGLLQSLLTPKMKLTRENDIVEALELLALSYFYTGQEKMARRYFTKLLYVRPDHKLNPFFIPPPAVAFFNQIRTQPKIRSRRLKIPKKTTPAEPPKKPKPVEKTRTLVKKIYLEQTVEHHSRIWVFLPFGLGQFKNGHPTKGAILASSQAATLATNIFCYLMLTTMKNKAGKFAASDLEVAKGLETTGYVSLGLFAGLWIYGMIDANAYYQPTTKSPFQTVREESTLQNGSTTTLGPVMFEQGAGLMFNIRFD